MRHFAIAFFLIAALACGLQAQTVRTVSVDATIPINTAVSGWVSLGACVPVGMIMPSAWTTASIAFYAATQSSSGNNVYDEFGSRVIIPVAASSWVKLQYTDTYGFRRLKIQSVNSSGVDVNQTAQRVITIVCR